MNHGMPHGIQSFDHPVVYYGTDLTGSTTEDCIGKPTAGMVAFVSVVYSRPVYSSVKIPGTQPKEVVCQVGSTDKL